MEKLSNTLMKKLQSEFLYLDNAKKIACVKLSGEVDLSNSSEFSSFIEKTFIQPWTKLIFDLEKLVYMNSSGFGALAGSIFREQDSKNRPVVLCKMNELLHPIFQILGFENICPIYDTIEQALQAPKNTKIQDAIEELHSSTQPQQEVTFPITRACTQCNRSSNFNKVGHYRCPFCRSIHLVDKYGQLQLVSKGNVPTPIEKQAEAPQNNIVPENDDDELPCDAKIKFSIPSDMKYLAQIRDFIFSFVENRFYNQDRNNMVVSLDEAVANAIEHAHNFDHTKRIYITLDVFTDKFIMTVKDSGVNTYRADLPELTLKREAVKEKGRGMGLILIKRMMDEISVAPTATNGTAIRMTKYYTKDSELVTRKILKDETPDTTFNNNAPVANNNAISNTTQSSEPETNNNNAISNTTQSSEPETTNNITSNTTETTTNSNNNIEDINNNVNAEVSTLDNQINVIENVEESVNLPTIEDQSDVLVEF